LKVLLCGEGPHDIGIPDHWDARRREYVALDGWMQPIVGRVLAGSPEFSARKRNELQVQQRDPNKRRLPEGHGAKAYLAKRAAVTGSYDVLIFMVDADSNDFRDWQRIVAEIEAGFALLDACIRCIACVPMAASESWLLSDPQAWATVADYNGANLPPRPETIWGARDNPAGNHPHRLFFRVCEAAGVSDDLDTRVRVAAATTVAIARARCPMSMEPFIAALEA
jgi:hypothetical protein